MISPHPGFAVPEGRELPTIYHGSARIPDRILNLTGATTLDQLVVLLARARVVVTTDSGSAHLGNAIGSPAVVLIQT